MRVQGGQRGGVSSFQFMPLHLSALAVSIRDFCFIVLAVVFGAVDKHELLRPPTHHLQDVFWPLAKMTVGFWSRGSGFVIFRDLPEISFLENFSI